MNLWHIGSELRRFGHGKLPPVAITVVILLPLLFGGLFVWSYWDPIGRIDRLPVAIVNSDTGAQVKGKELRAGDKVVERLKESKKLNLTEATAEEAREGVSNGTYYFALELPTDFSEAAASANSDNPHQATLHTMFNNNNGLIATSLGNQVVSRVLAAMNEALGTRITQNLLVGFNTVSEGMHTAADGAKQVQQGANSAAEGGQKLADGSRQLNDGAKQLDEGAEKLHEGTQTLNQGIGQASDAADQLASGLSQLQDATARLGDGATQVAGGVQQITGIAQQAANAQEQLIIPLVNLEAQLRQLNLPLATEVAGQVDGVIKQIRSQGLGSDTGIMQNLQRLSAGASEIQRQLSDPNAEYAAGMQRAASGAQQLATGMQKLEDGSQQLVVGSRTLADGTSRLVEGSEQLTVGAEQLRSGLVRLDEGAGELALKISEGADKVPTYGDNIEDYARAISTPVAQRNVGDTLSLFGYGLAPIFISLGLFMGSITTFMLINPLQRRAVDSGMAPLRVVLASYLPALVVGLAQASVVFAVQRFALGLRAEHEVGMWLSMCLVAAVFQLIVLGINALLGITVGRVLSIVLMALQIVSSGGLYPPETQPAPLRWFHHIDPMTYSTNLLRHMIFAGTDERTWQALLWLGCIWLVFCVLAVLGAARARTIQMKDLHPEVAL